jgi:GT2 family glycosyltransferase
VLIVTWNERAMVERSLPPLVEQLGDGDELIVADNGSADGTVEAVERLAPRARVVRMPSNDGYMRAANAAAALASGDVLITLDADAVVAPGFCEAIRRPVLEERGWDAWMGLLTMAGGREINTSGGVCHFTGISWAGEVGQPVPDASPEPREVGFVTGACLATTREAWERCGPFPPDYFLYFDDVDYSWRVRLAGGRIGIEPTALVDHLYEFSRGRVKWRLLERNRWASMLTLYPGALLILVAPALLATEAALVLVAAREGWLREKLRAWGDLVRWLPRLMRERRALQARRRVSAREFAAWLVPELSSPYIGGPARSRPVEMALRAYWAAVMGLLRFFGR